MSLFESPIRQKRVSKDTVAYQFRNGTIVINEQKYVMYSMTEAIKLYRKQRNEKRKKI